MIKELHKLRVFFTKQYQLWLIIVVNALLLLFFIILLFFQGYEIYSSFKQRSVAIKKNKTPEISSATTKEIIPQYQHIFYSPPTATITEAENHNLMLRGIILGDQENNNLAIISSSETDEAIYQQGDKLPNGAIVSTIYADHVMLSYRGKVITLSIPWEKNNKSSSAPDSNNQIVHMGKPFSNMKEP